MFFLLPAALGFGLAWWLYKGRSAAMTGISLGPSDRAAVDALLAAPNDTLVALGQSAGKTRARVVSDIYLAAHVASEQGDRGAAAELMAKANQIADEPDPACPILPPAPLTGAFVTPTLPLSPGAPERWTPPGAEPPPFSGPAFGVPSGLMPMRCRERVWILAEPRVFDGARGPKDFTAPAGFPVGVRAFAPPGFAQVLVQHPEHGPVEGFVEANKLAPEGAPVGAAGQGAQSAGIAGAAGGAKLAGPTAAQKRRMRARSRRGQARAKAA